MDNIRAFEDPSVNWVVSACPTCTVALRHEFAATLRSEGQEDWAVRADALAAKVREMKDSDTCCGMGGSYSLKFPEISAPILKRKLENVRATGVGTVAMDCPGCMLQIGGGLDLAEWVKGVPQGS